MPNRILSGLVQTGHLEIVDTSGRTHVLGNGEGPRVVVRILDRMTAWKILTKPELHAAEAYMDGGLSIEQGTLDDLITLFSINLHRHRLEQTRWQRRLAKIWNAVTSYRYFNPVGNAQRKVAHHYDLKEDLFRLFLDRDMQYSCAYFMHPDDDLETAQEQKKRHLAAKLLLEPGQRVLDIGSGWGGLALFLARDYGVDVTGLTLSKEQHAVATRRAREMGLQDRVRFALRDYRQETGTYDRIVSVGMFEHVGRHHYGEFFARVKELLSDDGIALLHSIGHQGRPGPINDWIAKYIFPGAYLPSLSEIFPDIERQNLWTTDLEILRLHYAETLRHWFDRFQAKRNIVRDMYDERFCRMWELYLKGCEMSFRHMGLMVFQLQLAKDRLAVPLTRDYIYETPHQPAESLRMYGE